MGYMIEITEHKKEKLSEHIENALHEMGRAMQCVETLGEHEYGHRDSYGMRGSYGMRDEWEDDDMGERRGRRRRDSRGRYM
jgi:hypothetical protein